MTPPGRHLFWSLVVLATGSLTIVVGLFVGRYVGLYGRADQEAVAVLGVATTATASIWMLRLRGVAVNRWTFAVVLAALAAVGAILLPDVRQGRGSDLDSRLVRAALRGEHGQVRDLLAQGANPNAAEAPLRLTPLLAASKEGHTQTVRILLEAGADPNRSAHGGQTSLMAAAMACRADVARLLLGHGAAPGARTHSGATARDIAENCPEVRNLLAR